CGVVDTHRQLARYCHRCAADYHDRRPGTLRLPRANPGMPCLVSGAHTIYVRTFEVCEEPFATKRRHPGRGPGAACRVRSCAATRSSLRECKLRPGRPKAHTSRDDAMPTPHGLRRPIPNCQI